LGFFDGPGLSSTQRTQIATLARETKVLQNLIVMNWGDTEIAERAFRVTDDNYNVPLVKVIIHKVTTVGSFAFDACQSLTTAIFPDVTTVNDHAFLSDRALRTLFIPMAVTINSNAFYNDAITELSCPFLRTIDPGGFRNTQLATISFPSLTHVNTLAFYECRYLVSAYLPVCINIGDNAFGNCTALRTITFPQSTATVDPKAFNGCSNLQIRNP
jgi:hypothetical protein